MAKSLFGGGALLTGAFLLSSLVFNVHTSSAENLAYIDSNTSASQTKDAPAVTQSGKQVASATIDISAEAAPPALTAANATFKGVRIVPNALGKTQTGAGPVESYTATAYSLGGRTASGAGVRRGLIAADRRVLPLGTRVRIDAGPYSGEYLVADRGSAVHGRTVDIWVPTTREALRFGRRPVRLTVLSYGAHPAARPRTNGSRH